MLITGSLLRRDVKDTNVNVNDSCMDFSASCQVSVGNKREKKEIWSSILKISGIRMVFDTATKL
jgi:hypothetical protein